MAHTKRKAVKRNQ